MESLTETNGQTAEADGTLIDSEHVSLPNINNRVNQAPRPSEIAILFQLIKSIPKMMQEKIVQKNLERERESKVLMEKKETQKTKPFKL